MSMLNSELFRSGSASQNIRTNSHSRIATANTTSSKTINPAQGMT